MLLLVITLGVVQTGDCYSTAVGDSTLAANTSGENNVAVGARLAIGANTTGTENVAVGQGLALDANTTASSNTAVGRMALSANTTGAQATRHLDTKH